MRWLVPSARARAELDHDSPSARQANTAANFSSTGCASVTTSVHTDVCRAKPRGVAMTPANGLSALRSRPISTRSRARWDSSESFRRNARAISVSRATSAGQASARVRASTNRIGRVASDTDMPQPRTTYRQASTTNAVEPSKASTSSSSSARSSPRAIRRAAGATSRRATCSTSAISAAIPD
ncbi:hypothetical protein D3C75_552830 [compost metagenome]